MLAHVGRDTRAGIGHVETNAPQAGIVPQRDADPPWPGMLTHRMMSVRHQVDDDLVKLMRVAHEGRDVVRDVDVHLDVTRTELVGQELERLLHDLANAYLASLGRALPDEREEIPHDANAAVRGLADLLGAAEDDRIAHRLPEKLGLTAQDREGIVELVGDA